MNNKEKYIDDSDVDTRAYALEISSAQHTFSELILGGPDLKRYPRIETSCLYCACRLTRVTRSTKVTSLVRSMTT